MVFRLVVLAVLLLATRVGAQGRSELREDLELFETALDRAVQEVSRPGTFHVLSGEHASRGYYLEGYGAVFLLPPRALPPAGRPRSQDEARAAAAASDPLTAALQAVEESLADVEPLPGLLEEDLLHPTDVYPAPVLAEPSPDQAMTGASAVDWAVVRKRLDERERIERRRERQLRELEEQLEAFQRDAESMRRLAERQMARLRERIPVQTVTSGESPAPAPQPEGVQARTPGRRVSAPPWTSWFELSPRARETPRSRQDVIAAVRAAVTRVVRTEGSRLRMLRPDERVVVAVDFVAQEGFVSRTRPERTLVVRVKVKELQDRLAGRIQEDELERRIEVVEY